MKEARHERENSRFENMRTSRTGSFARFSYLTKNHNASSPAVIEAAATMSGMFISPAMVSVTAMA